MELELPQKIFYSNKGRIPANEVADALYSLSEIVQYAPAVLEKLFPDSKIVSIETYVSEIRTGSLIEDLILKIVFGDQQGFQDFADNIRQKIGLEKFMREKPELMTIVILLIVLAGVGYMIVKDTDLASAQKKASIEANNNTIINIGAGVLEMTSEDLKALIQGTVKDTKDLSKHVTSVIKPAKRDPEASISIGGGDLKITKETVKASPQAAPESKDEEFMKDVEELELEIRATDMDSYKRGWAASVPSLDAKRVKIQIDPTIPAEDLLKSRTVKISGSMVYKLDASNKIRPKLIYIRSVLTN